MRRIIKPSVMILQILSQYRVTMNAERLEIVPQKIYRRRRGIRSKKGAAPADPPAVDR
jgi:hypothetical protein